jgi:hypothetical protein
MEKLSVVDVEVSSVLTGSITEVWEVVSAFRDLPLKGVLSGSNDSRTAAEVCFPLHTAPNPCRTIPGGDSEVTSARGWTSTVFLPVFFLA